MKSSSLLLIIVGIILIVFLLTNKKNEYFDPNVGFQAAVPSIYYPKPYPSGKPPLNCPSSYYPEKDFLDYDYVSNL